MYTRDWYQHYHSAAKLYGTILNGYWNELFTELCGEIAS